MVQNRWHGYAKAAGIEYANANNTVTGFVEVSGVTVKFGGLALSSDIETQWISVGHPKTKAFTLDLSTEIALNKNDHGTLAYSLGELTDPKEILSGIAISGGTLTYYGNEKDDGEATQQIKITSDNYTDLIVTIKFQATQKTGVTIVLTPVSSYVHDGNAKSGYTGTATALPYTGTLTYKYEGREGTDYNSAEPPTNVGKYKLIVTVPETDPNYTTEPGNEYLFEIKVANTDPIRNTQLASRTLKVQTIGNYIVLENLPTNAKVDVYNLQGKRIYSTTSHSPLFYILTYVKNNSFISGARLPICWNGQNFVRNF